MIWTKQELQFVYYCSYLKKKLKNKAQIKIVDPNRGEEPLLILLSNLYKCVFSEENRNKSFKKYLNIFFLIHLFFYLVFLSITEEMKTILWIAFFHLM